MGTTDRIPSPRDLAVARLAFADKARDDFRTFFRWAWPIVEPTPLEWSRVLDAKCEHLQAVADGELQRLWINEPPGFAKSLTMAVIWPAWLWVRDPSIRYLTSTYAKDLTVRDSLRCRQILRDPDYRGVFASEWGVVDAQPWELAPDQDAKTFYRTTRAGHRFSTSVGSGTTGHRGEGIIIDDPLSATDAHSEPRLAQALDHVARVLPSRLNDQRTGWIVGNMQRLNERDPTAWAEENGFTILRLAMEYEPARHCRTSIGWHDWRNVPGELLDPERYPLRVVEDLRRKPGYAAEYQQDPASDAGNIIRTEWVQHYDALPHEVANHGRWLQSWDLRAGGKSATSSFAVGQVWVAHRAARYLVDQVRGRWTTAETMDAIRSLSQRYPQATARIVEDKADGRPVLNLLGAELALIPHKPVGSKEDRVRAQAYQFESGNVWIPRRFPSESADSSVTSYVHELTKFPQAPNDDQVDATSQALERMADKGTESTWAPVTLPPSASDQRRGRAKRSF